MNRMFFLAAACAAASAAAAPIIDDFSQGGWRRFSTTPGKMTAQKGALRLVDDPKPPNYVTVSKTFAVDVDRTPWFLVDVVKLSDRGIVKLIRLKPYDKRVALSIRDPGLYAVDMRRRFGWKGKLQIQVCLYAAGMGEQITYGFVKFAERLTPQEEQRIQSRKQGGNKKLKTAPFEVVPLFNACAVYFKSPRRPGLRVAYRKKGGPWRRAFPLVYVKEDGMYRGSIVNLEEDAAYELRLADAGGRVLASKTFRTWRSEVPVAKTIVLDETNFKGSLTVRERGAADGWIKFTAKKGFVLRNDRKTPLIELYKAQYVILEGLTLRGGSRNAIAVRRCDHVRIVNCDIAGWGRVGVQRFDRDGKFYAPNGNIINWDCAILLDKCGGTVVERCYIHDPVNRANSWYYSHPAGPEAVGAAKPHSTVLRYNDFIGSDLHRWNDAVEGAGNYHVDGGFNRDADIYGNFMCFANDDAIEIDGGQTNVRVFLNKFEGCLCGVSIQGCMSGPSYVFRNLLVNMGDERGVAGQTIKTSSYANGPSAVSFIFNNTCYGPSADLHIPYNLRIVAKNNIFAGRRAVSGRERSPQSESDYNLLARGKPGEEPHSIVGDPRFADPQAGLFALRKDSPAIGRGVAIDNFAEPRGGRVDLGAIPFGSGLVLPVRPIPVFLDRYQLVFSISDFKAARTRTVRATVRGDGFSSGYRIAQNEAFDWFQVSPARGTLKSGQTLRFTVSLRPEKMKDKPLYRGAFLIRLDNGYSRPVLVYARTDVRPPIKPRREGAWIAYLEAEAPSSGHAYKTVADAGASGGRCILLAGPRKANPAEYRFRVPKAGKYFVLARVRSDAPVPKHDSFFFGLDSEPLGQSCVRSAETWTWSLAAHNRSSFICLQGFKLSAGEHALKLAPRESIYLDLIAVTDNPGAFE